MTEWSDTFWIKVEYEVQVSEGYLADLRKMRGKGLREKDLADEIASAIVAGSLEVNVVDSDSEWDFSDEILDPVKTAVAPQPDQAQGDPCGPQPKTEAREKGDRQ